MIPLRQKMIEAMQLRGFSPQTHQSYLAAVSALAQHYGRSPEALDRDELQAYFLYLVKERGRNGWIGVQPADCAVATDWFNLARQDTVMAAEKGLITLVSSGNLQPSTAVTENPLQLAGHC